MIMIKFIKVVPASVLLILCLSSYYSLISVTQLNAQNVTQPLLNLNNSRGIISYPTTSSVSEMVSANSTVVPSYSNSPYIIVEPPVSSSEAIFANYTARAEYLFSQSFTSIDASISRSEDIVDGSSSNPLNIVVANESISSVIGTNVK